MRNLNLIYKKQHKLSCDNGQTFVLDGSDDTESADKAYLFTSDKLIAVNCLTGNETVLYEFSIPDKTLIGAEYLAFERAIVWAFSDGEVWLYEFDTELASLASLCEHGIECMRWSPDQENVIFVTRTRSMVVMSRQFDLLSEAENILDEVTFGDQEFITVGWGKKETQFHGSEGKAAAKIKSEVKLQENTENADHSITVTWREDGEFYAISYFGKAGGRMFKVFNKDGLLQFTSELCNGLEACIAWRPTGNWIAVPQTLPNKYIIALFEKNGLKHRDFTLPFRRDVEKVVDLGWSSDSECLSIITENVETKASSLYLYTVSNYHWYLKQHFMYNNKIQNLVWYSNINATRFKAKSLAILMDDASFLMYKWDYSANYSRNESSHDESIVAVIDGSNLLLTNFRNVVVPPPMCAFTVKHETAINACGFLRFSESADDDNDNNFFIVDAAGKLILSRCMFSDRRLLTGTTFVGSFDLSSFNPLSMYFWTWLRNDVFLCCSEVSCLILKLEREKSSAEMQTLHQCTDEIAGIGALSSSKIFVSTPEEIHVHQIDNLGLLLTNSWSEHLPIANYDQIDCVQCNETYYAIAFKNRESLHINNNKIAFNVTSYFVHDDFLIYTTYDKLNFYDLQKAKLVSERKIETGGRLVVVIPKQSRTVLQLPRGNLETLDPRILSLKIIGRHLDSLDYFKAFDILRKQRLNLNIIVDHDYNKFIENIPRFLSEISNPNWLNLFLSELQNIDVTQTMYASNYESETITRPKIPADKMETICRMLCENMEGLKSNNLLLPIITTHVKRNNLETALGVIWQMKQSEVSLNSGEKYKADDALKYLICLVDVNELYNVALGIYDFDLVMFVANKSQKDPKEYVKFLNDIKSIDDENYRRYTIDVYLKRYEKALANILRCENETHFDEAIELIEKYKLYAPGLDVLLRTDEKYKKIANLYGDYLRVKGGNRNLWEASIMYERGCDLKQALTSAKHILDLYRCEYLMKKMESSEEEIEEFCTSMIPALEDAKSFDKISHILVTHRKDTVGGLIPLLNGQLFKDAGDLIKRTSINVCDQMVSDSIEYAANEYIDSLTDSLNQFVRYKTRLDYVRKNPPGKTSDFYDPNFDDNDDASSMNSASSKRTGKSSASGKSSQSSKNRRKMERKVLSLKEGNPYEELALIDVIHTTIESLIEQRFKVEQLCCLLVEVGQDSVGVFAQDLYRKIVKTIKDSLDEIFTSEMQVPENIDYTNYQIIQKSKFYQLLKPNMRFKPKIDFQFDELSILK